MNEATQTMKVVQRSGERFSYRVESASQPGMGHVVDLTANKGLGSCTCEAYRFGVAKNQRAGVYIEWRKGRKGCSECRHIWGARRQFMRKNIIPLMAAFTQGQPEDVGEVIREFFKWKGVK